MTDRTASHNKSVLRIHHTLEKGLAHEKKKAGPLAATWNEVKDLCFNQIHGNLIQVKDPDGKTKAKNAWSRQWIIDPVPVPCVPDKLKPPLSAPPTQYRIADAWADGGVSRLSNNTPIYACVGGKDTEVPAGHIISGLSNYTASGAANLQCSINGGETVPRKIGLKRKYHGGKG